MTARATYWLFGCVSLFLCAAVGALTGCGNGTETSTKASPETRPESNKHAHFIVPGRLPVRFRREGCIDAVASVGHRPGLINISVHCIDPGKSEEEGFSIGRYNPAHPLMIPDIVGYTQEPRVVDHGSAAQRGQCQLQGKSVSCSVPVLGSKRVQMNVWVPPGTRCSAGVTVSTHRSGTCSPEPCVGSLLIYALFRGKPRGC